MSWQRGRATIDRLLAEGELESVTASPELAERLMDDAVRHLASADAIRASDLNGAYQLAYDAARKACAALLAPQGLRATTRGGHVAVQDAVREQFNGDGGFNAFRALSRLRRTRAAREYPDPTTPTTTPTELEDGLAAATEIVAAARQLLDSGRIDRFVPGEAAP